MAKNQRNIKFQFGFLNNNQDATDLQTPEATEALALDADDLGLGTLRTSSYITGTEAAKTFGVAPAVVNVAGVDFTITPNKGGALDIVEWKDESAVLHAFPAATTQPPDNTNSKPGTPLMTTAEGMQFDVSSSVQDVNGFVAKTLVGVSYKGSDRLDLVIGVTNDTGGSGGTVTYTAFSNGHTATPGPPIVKGNDSTIVIDGGGDKNIVINFSTAVDYVGTISNPGNIDIVANITALPDGEYAYAQLTLLSVKAQNKTEVRSPLGPPTTVIISNFNELGERVSVYTPALRDNSEFGGSNETYRRDDTTNGEFVRVFDSTVVTTSDPPLPDTQTITGLNQIIIAQKDLDDENELSDAIGNGTQQRFVKLFSFDARLWRVPFDRQDLLLFGEASPKILNWSRANSFSFDGDIVDIIEIRDPTTVGGTLTKVVFTDNGIYNITGSGISADPYVSTRVVKDIFVEPLSIVDMNGLLIFMSQSPSSNYDDGPYGQKTYTYNLQSVTEVSARVKNANAMASSNVVEFSELRGSDKYLIKKTGQDKILLYHRDANGWIEYTTAAETGKLWKWASKTFTPDILQRYRIAYSKFVKIDFIGDIILTFEVEGPTAVSLISIPIILQSSVRTEILQRMPANLGRKWRFKVEAQGTGFGGKPILHNMYFVT